MSSAFFLASLHFCNPVIKPSSYLKDGSHKYSRISTHCCSKKYFFDNFSTYSLISNSYSSQFGSGYNLLSMSKPRCPSPCELRFWPSKHPPIIVCCLESAAGGKPPQNRVFAQRCLLHKWRLNSIFVWET